MTTLANSVIRIFIASPGGVEAEREIVRRLIEEINACHADHFGHIVPVGWEDTPSSDDRAQDLINKDLDKCDYFIGIIGDHWGSSPNDRDSKYTSGFEEEFERARSRKEKGLLKDISLLFKQIPESRLKDLGPSATKVVAFQEECKKRRRPYFQIYRDEREFERLVRIIVSKIGWNEVDASKPTSNIEIADSDTVSDVEQNEQPDGLLFSPSASAYIQEMARRSGYWEATSAEEIARFRLIAYSTYRPGNDDPLLGIHDANLVFIHRDKFALSPEEHRTLLDTGLANYHQNNAPLWGWLAMQGGLDDPLSEVRFSAVVAKDHVRRNAIRILQLLGEGVPELEPTLDARSVISIWLGPDRDANEVAAALDFLSTNGDDDDLSTLQAFLPKIASQHRNSAEEAIIAMTAKRNPAAALECLHALDTHPLSKRTIDLLFSAPDAISTSTLLQCAKLKADEVRFRSVQLLIRRNSLERAMAEKMLADRDYRIREITAVALDAAGDAPDDLTLEKALTSSRKRGFFGYLGPSDDDDKRFWESFRLQRLLRLPYENLAMMTEACDVFDSLTPSAFYLKFGKRRLVELRSDVSDGFKAYFDRKINKVVAEIGEIDLTTRIRSLEMSIRRDLVADGLQALTIHGDGSDIHLVRSTITKWSECLTEKVLDYISRFGDFSDVDRILEFYSSANRSLAVIDLGSQKRARAVAQALLWVAPGRIPELLDRELAPEVRRWIYLLMSRNHFKSITLERSLEELKSIDGEHRKAVAVRLVSFSTQSRLRDILAGYLSSNEQKFYNAIHWLDLGASMPQQIARSIAARELERLLAFD